LCIKENILLKKKPNKQNKCHASLTLNDLRKEHGGEKQSPDQKILPGIATKWLETGGRGAIEAVFMWSDQSGKTWL
jgi:hypothetical protein